MQNTSYIIQHTNVLHTKQGRELVLKDTPTYEWMSEHTQEREGEQWERESGEYISSELICDAVTQFWV